MKVAIIGLGLLGGSFGLALKQHYKTVRIWGIDHNQNHILEAINLGIIDKIGKMSKTIPKMDWIVIAIPVDAIPAQLKFVLDHLKKDSVVLDLGSTKHLICQSVEKHPNRAQYVASHPIAGTEYSGPTSAFAKLIDDKVMIICDAMKTDTNILKKTLALYRKLNLKVRFMDAEIHDLHLSFISHLSHISSFALSNTVLEKHKYEQEIFDMAGTGFASTVRLAKSSARIWVPIFKENKSYLAKTLKSYIKQVSYFLKAIENDDLEHLKTLIDQSNNIKNILD